jgi:hypothetical protein
LGLLLAKHAPSPLFFNMDFYRYKFLSKHYFNGISVWCVNCHSSQSISWFSLWFLLWLTGCLGVWYLISNMCEFAEFPCWFLIQFHYFQKTNFVLF